MNNLITSIRRALSESAVTVTITKTDGEYRVPGPDGREESAYYTDDREDANDTAKLMWGDDVSIRHRWSATVPVPVTRRATA